ncbi:MAG: hypothetical protein WC581_06165 [Thermodesulfovibrionales bacterium]
MKSNSSSWKEKVDPAFDSIIGKFVKFFDSVELISNTGWLVLNEEYLKNFCKVQHGWILNYEKEMTKERIINFARSKTMPAAERNRKQSDLRKDIFDSVKTLSEDSQKYYKKVFEPYYSDKISCDYFKDMTPERWKEEVKRFIGHLALLELHTALIETENNFKDMDKSTIKKVLRPSFIMNFLLSVYNVICLLVFKKQLPELMKAAKGGDEQSFFKILQIDRTAVECKWAKEMIRKAQLAGDEKFFKKMAKAIRTPPLDNRRIYGHIIIVLLLFWRYGFRELENDERIELLEDSGIRVQDDPETFRKFVDREIKPLFEDSQTPLTVVKV